MNSTKATTNDRVYLALKDALDSLSDVLMNEGVFAAHGERLRTCKAVVYETPCYYLLRSYDTYVACISKSTGICYDGLRIVYGYTATSAQHISKFCHDYNAAEKITAR